MIICVFHHQVHTMQTQMMLFQDHYAERMHTMILVFFSELWTPCHPEGCRVRKKGEVVQTHCLIVMAGAEGTNPCGDQYM